MEMMGTPKHGNDGYLKTWNVGYLKTWK